MLDLPDRPVLDKDRLVGACLRLPVVIDAGRLATEIDALGAAVWGTTDGRVGVHSRAEAVFLRGYAPAQGELPIEDRLALDGLPYVRDVLGLLAAPPLRCLLARLPAGGTIAPHIDRAPYFAKTLRIHVPVTTSDRVFMLCAGLTYRMRAGEVWALNNSTHHGVWNADPQLSRTHLICDFLPAPALLDLLARGDRGLGQHNPEVRGHLDGLRP
ncbi:MAG: aspartyl/asparaginyl beta-hydroxylase domain-containing protein [Gammaproteobacteria bacterium]|nr:aspartyl/asparaginyl beta-hydroxylase domain-containing protein [Gammaproteobacteria bacterium]MDH5275275.1 aspartyl/asparaginyl beta-hydroxylase domain-containing protein [Gammaproteobacteria bacterium]